MFLGRAARKTALQLSVACHDCQAVPPGGRAQLTVARPRTPLTWLPTPWSGQIVPSLAEAGMASEDQLGRRLGWGKARAVNGQRHAAARRRRTGSATSTGTWQEEGATQGLQQNPEPPETKIGGETRVVSHPHDVPADRPGECRSAPAGDGRPPAYPTSPPPTAARDHAPALGPRGYSDDP